MAEYHLTAPLKDEDVQQLQIGDIVYISGEAFTCRSRLQKYIFDEKNTLPFSTDATAAPCSGVRAEKSATVNVPSVTEI